MIVDLRFEDNKKTDLYYHNHKNSLNLRKHNT